MERRRLVIHGRVQGVGFRASLAWEAGKLGVTGWVRNRRDGDVEAMVQGQEDAIEALLRWAWDGPPAARVDDIQMQPGSGEYQAFERWATA